MVVRERGLSFWTLGHREEGCLDRYDKGIYSTTKRIQMSVVRVPSINFFDIEEYNSESVIGRSEE